MNKQFMEVYITNALIEMSMIDQKYWHGDIGIKEWNKRLHVLKEKIVAFIASSEPVHESEVL